MSKHEMGESRWNASEMLITHICFIEESRHVIKIYCNSCLHTMLCNILDTFLDRATHSFGLDRDIFRQTRTYEPNSVTMKLEVLGFDSEDINVERESGGEKHLFSSSHFQQSFTLGPGDETDKLTANLAMVF